MGSDSMGTEGVVLVGLAYGAEYARLFLGPQLGSLLDPSNLPAVKDRASFVVFTDEATRPVIEADLRFQALRELVPTEVYCLRGLGYEGRYDAQGVTLGLGMARAYREGRALMYLTADGCYGRGCVPALLGKLAEGYGAVCGQAIRSSAEAVEAGLRRGALGASDLFRVGFATLNPLWVASHWESPCFSAMPYALLWSDREQLVMRMASVSVHLIRPSKALLGAKGCPDMVLPLHMVAPYYGYDWAEFPVVNVEPLRCFYPPFQVGLRASVGGYLAWARRSISRESLPNLQHRWVYQDPDHRPSAASTEALLATSDAVVDEILATDRASDAVPASVPAVGVVA